MNEQEFEKLKNIEISLRRINQKVKLLSLLNKAKKEYEQNNLSDCALTCQEILVNDSQNALALRGLGCVMQSKGDFKKAIEYYNQAVEYSSSKEIEYTLLGTVYYMQDKFDQAIEYYSKAIEINDSYDPAYEGRNQSLLENHLQILDLQEALIKSGIV